MPKNEITNRLKRLRNHYRLVVMNEDTYEEVVQFKLTRWSVYIVLSAVFIILIALTASLIIFTPLKYYLPGSGYGDARQIKEYRELKIRTDSMERTISQQTQYYSDIQKVLQGNVKPRDTSKLKMPKLEDFDD